MRMPTKWCLVSAAAWSIAAWMLLTHLLLAASSAGGSRSIAQRQQQEQEQQLSELRRVELFQQQHQQQQQQQIAIGRTTARSRRRGHSSSNSAARKQAQEDPNASSSPLQRRAFYFPDPNAAAVDPSRSVGDDEQGLFYPGREWRDTDGKPIQAHGGGILRDSVTGVFYWYGENKDGTTYRMNKRSTARVDLVGISCYSSRDLWRWKNEGVVLKPEADNVSSSLHISKVLERPKVIYNSRSRKYVMWMHVDNANYSKASVGVAVSTRPEGPFTYLGSFRPHGFDSRDMTVFKDEDTGAAYLVYSSLSNSELHVSPLSEDYLRLQNVMARVMVNQHREAPAVFKHRGFFYMVTSGCTGWSPNQAMVHVAESMMGPWHSLRDPSVGASEEFRATTFFSQVSFVLPLPGLRDMFIFIGDRWNPADLRDSRYVWLPLTMDGPVDEPVEGLFEFPQWYRASIRWHEKWRLPVQWNYTL